MARNFRELVGIAVGEASMCWSEPPKGVFDSGRASKIIDRVVAYAAPTGERANNTPMPLGHQVKTGPRRFFLERDVDATGVSGTGRVAEGVQWSNGWCSVVWLTAHKSAAFYLTIDEVIEVHGHGGNTRIVWADCAYCDHPIDAHWMDNCGGCDRAHCPCVLMGQDQQIEVKPKPVPVVALEAEERVSGKWTGPGWYQTNRGRWARVVESGDPNMLSIRSVAELRDAKP